MRSLAELQEFFVRSVLKAKNRAQSEPDDVVVSNGALSAAERLGLYRKHMQSTHFRALSHIFPALHRALGTHNFAKLSAHYLDENISRDPWIDTFGGNLPSFLGQLLPSIAELREWKFLPVLAQYEYGLYLSSRGNERSEIPSGQRDVEALHAKLMGLPLLNEPADLI